MTVDIDHGHASAAPTGLDAIDVVARHDWLPDESIRFDGAGAEIWPAGFTRPRAIVVHHTRTENGDMFPIATLHRIARYHAVERGWGDIGYNFLILDDGRILEGRTAGEAPRPDDQSVIGAHAYRANHGSVGVAMVGNFDLCEPTVEAWSALDRLCVAICSQYDIDPLAEGVEVGRSSLVLAHAIVGHGSISDTTCPGAHVSAGLLQFRHTVAASLT